MMETESKRFLEELLEIPSPSGFEAAGQRRWAEAVRPEADTLESDAYGNIFASLNAEGGTPRVLVSGHSDEIALMVSYINDEGYLFFQAIGGINPGVLRGQRVWVHGKGGPVAGVIGALALHLVEKEDRNKVPELHDLFIDLGVDSREAALEMVSVGDAVTFSTGYQPLYGSVLAARGCDNRVGAWVAAEVLRRVAVRRAELKACLLAASTIQEENGLYGAHMLGYRLEPDMALVVDVTHATDTPSHSKPRHGEVKLGKGPTVSIGSSNHPVLVARLRAVAEKEGLPLQVEAAPRYTGTDADAIFLQRGGIPSVNLGVPTRYMHSPTEVVDFQDLEHLVALLVAFVLDLEAGEQMKVPIE